MATTVHVRKQARSPLPWRVELSDVPSHMKSANGAVAAFRALGDARDFAITLRDRIREYEPDVNLFMDSVAW